MNKQKLTLLDYLKILVLLIITPKAFMLAFIPLEDIFQLHDLLYLLFDIGQIITAIFLIIYLHKKFNFNLKSLLIIKKRNMKLLILTLLMFFCSYIIINFLTNTIMNMVHIIQPTPESDSNFNSISDITVLFLLLFTTIKSPIIEEIFFRGLFLLKFKEDYNQIFALILSSLIFCLLHSSGYGKISAFLTGLLFGIIALKTNTIFYTIIGHIFFNSLTTIFGLMSKNSTTVNFTHGTLHFNPVVNITCTIIFIVTLFIIFLIINNESSCSKIN